MNQKLSELEDELFYAEDGNETPPKDIVAYNELRSCADIYRMYKQGILVINPEFQRDVVWQGPSQTRFIDSLIKQLPIPSMCFSFDPEKQEWLVIDGLQRISTIIKFLEGDDWTLSKLDDIEPKISGVSAAKIKNDNGNLRKFYSAVENLTIPITVLRCNHSKYDHLKYLFTIFHRLNSEGTRLNNQEIRNCIFSGTFNRALKEISDLTEWKKLLKNCKLSPARFRDREFLLRIISLTDNHINYNGKLAKFLNEYMHANRYINDEKSSELIEKYRQISQLLNSKVFNGETKKYSTTVFESLIIGVASCFPKIDEGAIKSNFDKMIGNDAFSEDKLKEGLSSKAKVTERISLAKSLFNVK